MGDEKELGSKNMEDSVYEGKVSCTYAVKTCANFSRRFRMQFVLENSFD